MLVSRNFTDQGHGECCTLEALTLAAQTMHAFLARRSAHGTTLFLVTESVYATTTKKKITLSFDCLLKSCSAKFDMSVNHNFSGQYYLVPARALNLFNFFNYLILTYYWRWFFFCLTLYFLHPQKNITLICPEESNNLNCDQSYIKSIDIYNT